MERRSRNTHIVVVIVVAVVIIIDIVSQLEEIGGLPNGIIDMWEATGSRKEARYTWDTFRNDNLAQRWRTKLRFDRLYLRHRTTEKKAAALKPVYFELVGLERVPSAGCFPSDHWGILTHFDIVSLADK